MYRSWAFLIHIVNAIHNVQYTRCISTIQNEPWSKIAISPRTSSNVCNGSSFCAIMFAKHRWASTPICCDHGIGQAMPRTCLFYEMQLLAGRRYFKCFYCHHLVLLWWKPFHHAVCWDVSCSTILKVWTITSYSRSHLPKSRLVGFSVELPVWAPSWRHFYPEIPSSIWTCFNTFDHKSDVCAIWSWLVNMLHVSLRF